MQQTSSFNELYWINQPPVYIYEKNKEANVGKDVKSKE